LNKNAFFGVFGGVITDAIAAHKKGVATAQMPANRPKICRQEWKFRTSGGARQL